MTAELMVFWDYDTQWGGDRSRAGAGPRDWGHLEFPNTDELLELHAEYDIPACFAVVGAAAESGERPYHDPNQIRRIHEAGHEIASHSLCHDWLPGLGRSELRQSLARSKDVLEQCIGDQVTSFVPPYNQPFDFPRGLSFSLSERRAVPNDRTDLGRLCDTLRETGYQFCRVSYRPMTQRLLERICRRRLDQPARWERIRDITCIRLNTPGGFAKPGIEMLERCAAGGGVVVVYGHPHSLHAGNSQDQEHLVPFLRRARQLVDDGAVVVRLPRQVTQAA